MKIIHMFYTITLLLITTPAWVAPIELGASVQMTGSLADTGRYYADGYQFAVDKINAAGGVKVGNSREKLRLKILDNKSNIKLSVKQYIQLVTKDNINFLLGPYGSDFVLADSAIAEKYKRPMIQGGGASKQIFSRGYQYIFGTLPSASDYYQSTIKAMMKLDPAPKTVALLYSGDPASLSHIDGARELIKNTPLKIVLDQKFDANTSNFHALLSLIKSKNIDAVLFSSRKTEAINFIRQAKNLDVNPKFYSFTNAVQSASFRDILKEDANYVCGMTPWMPSKVLKDDYFVNGEEFVNEYKKRFGYEPDYHVASAVANIEAFVKAIEAANSLEPNKVRDAIAKLNFNSLYGQIRFNVTGQIDLPQSLVQIQNGKLVTLYKQNDFIEKPLYPMPVWSKR
ncbi:MAG TPA: amino acid ABC transporter substrate-binding protein [Gammaproteobacteria bacterium]|nr:amino acid ABC transporter substrate-binding protein [Gammaproteobacteria bacterium]